MAITINGSGTVTGINVGGLPDGIVDTDMLANNAVTVAKAAGSVQGIQEIDQWRINNNLALAAGETDLTTNWERNDSKFSLIGTGMSESSGIFTFPSTGIWHVTFVGYSADSDASRYAGAYVKYSSDSGSNWYTISQTFDGIFDQSSDTVYGAFMNSIIFDVTDASTHRLKVTFAAQNACGLMGSSTSTRTHITFLRLANT